MSADFDREALIGIFVAEATDGMATLWQVLHPADESVPAPEAMQEHCVIGHKLRGAASIYGFPGLATMGALLETVFERATAISVTEWPLVVETLRDLIKAFRTQLERIARGDEEEVGLEEMWTRRCGEFIQAQPALDQTAERDQPSESQAEATERQGPAVSDQAVMTGTTDTESRDSSPRVEAVVDEALTEEYLMPALDAEVLSYFAPEAQEYLEALEGQLLRLEKTPNDQEIIHHLFRTAHTLKGSAYTVGFKSIGDLTHHIEDFMGAVREGRMRVVPGVTDVILRSVDVIRALMRRDVHQLEALRKKFTTVMRDLRQLEQMSKVESQPVDPAVMTGSVFQTTEGTESTQSDSQKAQENRVLEEREVIRVSRDRLERLLNLVGELVIGRGRLEQRLVVLEQLSHQVLGCKNRLVESVRTFEDKHAFTVPTSAPSAGQSAGKSFPGLSDFGSLEFDKYDDFNILARRVSEVTADINESMSQLSGSIRRAHEDMSELQQLTLGMRDEIARARMVPVGTPFTRFRRATREMARATGKEVTLVTSGEHTEVDTGVVERLVDPLIHLVRNAVYHGIEPAAVRMARGKPSAGTIYLHAAHRGSAVLIEVEDDGAGLDLEKIKAKAITRGLVRPEVAQALPESEVIKFIFLPGFSTAEQIGDQAGRGVGLDVVKRVIEAMNGQLEVESVRGVGTKFTLHLPLTLLIATALLVRVGTDRYAIPLPSVREVTMPSTGSIQTMGDRTVLQMGDEAVEVQPLRQMLRRETGVVEGPTPVVIVRTATGPLGLAVDELLGRQEIVIKTLGTLKPLERSCFGGATIDPEGRVVLVLDIGRLVSRDKSGPLALVDESLPALLPEIPTDLGEQVAEVPQKHLPILLIDDSLSIRKFVGRMLESAGYPVETAVDGEEGLRKAAAQTYRLIITDLEMPKVNGFEVIQALRSRPQTQATPIIVMTTRAGDKHRQMAIDIGATAYIAKPVEERALIREIERWTGQETGARA